MNKILFICLGNVARSQMAESFYNQMTNSKNATSAGLLDFTPEKYVNPTKEVIEVMMEEGIDVSQNRVKFLTKEMVADNDHIYVLCEEEKCPDFLLNSGKVIFWGNIEDPFATDTDNFRKKRDLIKNKILSIISQ